MLISASITRDSSPPEATSRSGPGGHAGVRADQELDGVATARAERRQRPLAGARPLLDHHLEGRLGHRQLRQLRAHRLRERAAALSTSRAQARRKLVERGRVALQLSLQPGRRLAGVREPVALGAAALGVLEHRFDRPAVLALQPRELLEALLDDREAPRVRLERGQVGAQLAERCPAARTRPPPRGMRASRAPRRCRRHRAARRPRPPAAPSRRASPSRRDRSPRTPRRRRDGASPPRPGGRARAPARAPRPRPAPTSSISAISNSRKSRSRSRAPSLALVSVSSRSTARASARRRSNSERTLEVLARRRTRPGSRAAPRRPSACGARAGRRRPPAGRRPRAAPARTRSGPEGMSASARRGPRGGRAPAPARRAGCARPARPAPGPPRAPAGGSKHALDICLVGAGAHDAPPRLPAEQQVERLGEHRLARAGLAGDRVQATVESQLGALDQQQVPDAQLDQHTLRLAAAPVRRR